MITKNFKHNGFSTSTSDLDDITFYYCENINVLKELISRHVWNGINRQKELDYYYKVYKDLPLPNWFAVFHYPDNRYHEEGFDIVPSGDIKKLFEDFIEFEKAELIKL